MADRGRRAGAWFVAWGLGSIVVGGMQLWSAWGGLDPSQRFERVPGRETTVARMCGTAACPLLEGAFRAAMFLGAGGVAIWAGRAMRRDDAAEDRQVSR